MNRNRILSEPDDYDYHDDWIYQQFYARPRDWFEEWLFFVCISRISFKTGVDYYDFRDWQKRVSTVHGELTCILSSSILLRTDLFHKHN